MIVTTAPESPPMAPETIKKPELAKAQAPNLNPEVIGFTKNETDSITKLESREAPELPDVDLGQLPGCSSTALPPGAKGRIRFQFCPMPVDALVPDYRRNVKLPASAKLILVYLGCLIAKSADQASCVATLAQLARLIGVSRGTLSANIWKLRLAGEILTTRVKFNERRWSYRFTLPALASRAVIQASMRQLAEDQVNKSAETPSPGRSGANSQGVDNQPSSSFFGPENQSPYIDPKELEDHHGTSVQDASGYAGPMGPEMLGASGAGQDTPKKSPSAKRQKLSPAMQAEIASRMPKVPSQAPYSLKRTESTQATLPNPPAREVPAGPVVGGELPPTPLKEATSTPKRKKRSSIHQALSSEQQQAARNLGQVGVHRSKAVQLATSHPARLIAKVLHDLKSQRGIRSAAGWVVSAIERGGYKAAGADPVDIETQRKAIRAREAAEAAKERAALSEAETQRQNRIETMIHPTRCQAWHVDAMAYLTRSERTLIERVGKDNPVAKATIWHHLEALAKTGLYQEPGS